MTKSKAAPAVEAPEVPAVAPEAAVTEAVVEAYVPAEAEEVAVIGNLTVLSNNTMTIIDNSDVVEAEAFEPGEEAETVTEINGFSVIEYK